MLGQEWARAKAEVMALELDVESACLWASLSVLVWAF